MHRGTKRSLLSKTQQVELVLFFVGVLTERTASDLADTNPRTAILSQNASGDSLSIRPAGRGVVWSRDGVG